jgi:hypothetical protein
LFQYLFTAKEYIKTLDFSHKLKGGTGWPSFGMGWHTSLYQSIENTPLPLQRNSSNTV